MDDARIIRTGSMDLEVSDVEAAVKAARTAILAMGGYVGASNAGTDGETEFAEISYRIPADRWEEALTDLRSLGGLTTKVVSEQTQAIEVTAQVVDLEARIRNLESSERALQAIAAKAIKISDVLEIQAQLTAVRGQIEQLTAQLKDLNDRAAFATLTARYAVPVVAVQVAQSEWDAGTAVDEASASLISTLQGLTDAGIWFVIVWLPILLVLGVDGGHRDRHRTPDGPRSPRPSPARSARTAGRGAVRGLISAARPRRPGPWLAPPTGPVHAWHDGWMTDQGERYDRMAAGYDRWWAPVLASSAAALLDRLEPVVASGASHVLDVGIGTGNLALPALERWPSVRVTGIDASSEMVGAVLALADDRLPPVSRDRLDARAAVADALPFDDGSFDVAMSSFVFQLVPSRAKAFREIRRVLRPGGTLAYVTWLTDRSPFAPDRVFDALLDEYGFDDPEGNDRAGDIPSVATAAAELRRAGFRDVEATPATLDYRFTVGGYISFLVEFDEETLFAEMPTAERRRFLATFRERLMALTEDELTFRAPIVFATGRRS